VNVAIHALGILLALPEILEVLEVGEVVEELSLGAGNTGRAFDLVTNVRVAEFKFIKWRGGAEAIRQNGLFVDVFHLACSEVVGEGLDAYIRLPMVARSSSVFPTKVA
jgi:hypothetical protein